MSVFDSLKSTVEEHPYLIGGVAVGAIVVIVYLTSSSSSNSATTQATTQTSASGVTSGTPVSSGQDDSLIEAELQASTTSAATQVQGQLQNNELQAQLSALQLSQATQMNKDNLAAKVQLAGYSAQTESTLITAAASTGNTSILQSILQTFAGTGSSPSNAPASTGNPAVTSPSVSSPGFVANFSCRPNGPITGVITGTDSSGGCILAQ